MYRRMFLLSVLLTFVPLLISAELFAQADVVEKRQKLMKDNGASAKAIKAAAEAKDYVTIEAKARDIMSNGDKVLDLFRAGRNAEKTKAKPEIWDKWEEFSNNPPKVRKAAGDLAEAAKAKDDQAITTRIKTLAEACASCHNTFRTEQYSKSLPGVSGGQVVISISALAR